MDAGAPEGDPADLPDPREFPDLSKWRLVAKFEQPNHVIKSTPSTVPANGQNLRWNPDFPTDITEERCIKAIETKPSVAAHGSIHHASSRFKTQNEDGEWETPWGRQSAYAYGKLGEVVPDDACRVAPTASKLRRSIHYYPDQNKVVDDKVEVGIWYLDEEFDRESAYLRDLRSCSLRGGDFDIPPLGKLMTQGLHSFDHPIRSDSWQPPMQLRGVAMRIEVL